MACEKLRATLLAAIIATAALPARPGAQEAVPAPEAPPAAAPEQDPAAIRNRLATALDGSLVDTQNGADVMVETAGYRRLLQIVAAVPAADASSRATRSFDHAAAMKDPDALRGEWVRVRGLFVGVRAERLDQPLDGHVDIWQGSVSDGDVGIVFDMLEKPEGLEAKRDVVDVEGIFYRTARYENHAGKMVEAPYLIARNVTRVDTSSMPVAGLAGGPFMAILIGAAVVFIVVRVVMMARDRGRHAGAGGDASRAIRQAAEQQRRAALAAAKPSRPTDPPVPTDSPAKPS